MSLCKQVNGDRIEIVSVSIGVFNRLVFQCVQEKYV